MKEVGVTSPDAAFIAANRPFSVALGTVIGIIFLVLSITIRRPPPERVRWPASVQSRGLRPFPVGKISSRFIRCANRNLTIKMWAGFEPGPMVTRFIRLHPGAQKGGAGHEDAVLPRHKQNLYAY
jgi:hypothetical protein